MPDYTGYEYSWANQNPLVTHNALYDLVSATSYTGFGMSHPLYNSGGQTLAFKWMVGNIDQSTDATKNNSNGSVAKSHGVAYRLDWTVSEYLSLGYAANIGSGVRNWQIHEVDGGYIRGDWTFNGMVTFGSMNHGAYNQDPATGTNLDAQWAGVSFLAAYKATPRLQLIGRADYIDNHVNGGGTYVGYNTTPGKDNQTGLGCSADSGLSPTQCATDGSNLLRLSVGTNYQITENTQWKAEYRLDNATQAMFLDNDGNASTTKRTLATAVVWAF
jgi:hypothetical protein